MVILLASSFLFAACSSNSGKQVYRTSTGENLVITGQEVGGYLTLNINGETIFDNISFYSKDINGSYKGYKVDAKCKIDTKMIGSDKECDIYINGQYASNLFFR